MSSYHDSDTSWWERSRVEYDDCPKRCITDNSYCGYWGMCATASLMIVPATVVMAEWWGV